MSTVACEEPFSTAVESSLLPYVCHNCFKHVASDDVLKCCSRCSTVYYCNTACQKRDWLNHSIECKCLRNCFPRTPNSFVRLLARFYFKTLSHGRSIVSFNSRSCEDLVDNYEELMKSEKHTENFSLIFCILTNYVYGVDVQQKKAELFSAYGKLVTNAFSITDAIGRVLGTGLYLGISVHNHSCIPDAYVRFEGSTAVMRRPQIGGNYDVNLTISYVDLMSTAAERNKILGDQFCFTCCCPRCEDREEDCWKLSVNSRCCAGGFCLVDATENNDLQQPLICFLCKKKVDLQISEALDYNMKAILELEDATLATSGYSSEVDRWLTIFNRYVQVLSPYNVRLATICQKLICAAESVGRTDILQDVAEVSLPAYRKYLPLGHPELTQRLRFAFLNKSDENPPEERRSLLLEVYESAVLSHGEDHVITKELMSFL
ncbi:Histone-lysine N-methyltransferase EZA1 [Parelaphostrongylus tenuis]|uniref:Histone-lysine N-methyltransferase EZA1 n=1 Tax=Parelaphostrongylus tenuis TaxID=148309 RepID=A0AAD5MIG9_PARTN|nr:Histone-lysine N-methyltransferase EZA1 [Parelaphostrongylus tenuis]